MLDTGFHHYISSLNAAAAEALLSVRVISKAASTQASDLIDEQSAAGKATGPVITSGPATVGNGENASNDEGQNA